MNLGGPVSALLLAFSGSVLAAETPSPRAQNPAESNSIGVARMQADGSIMIGVPGPGSSGRAEAVLVLMPGDTQYQALVDHVGGLMPGETKPIPPWPDAAPAPRDPEPSPPETGNR